MRDFRAKAYQHPKSNPFAEVFDVAARYDDIINLSIGDPDIKTPQVVIDKAFADASAGHTKYTDPRGYRELRDEIRSYYQAEYGVSLRDEEVFITASGLAAMYLALLVLLDPGDEVIIPDPYFSYYLDQVESAGGKAVFLPTYAHENFAINMERLEGLCGPRTKAILINSPNNPTGVCLTRENLQELADFCQRKDLLVVADDIYTNYCYQTPFVPIRSIPGMEERTVTVNSFSKNYIMTGFRIGNLIAPPPIIAAVQQINEYIIYSAPSVSQRAALWALRERKTIEPPIFNCFRERMEYAVGRINALRNMSVPAPEGSFYLFPSIRETGLSSAEVTRRILEEVHVLVLPGDNFGACGEGHLRIACTVENSVMGEAFDRLRTMDIFA